MKTLFEKQHMKFTRKDGSVLTVRKDGVSYEDEHPFGGRSTLLSHLFVHFAPIPLDPAATCSFVVP